MKKVGFPLLALALSVVLFAGQAAQALSTSAVSAILVEQGSGRVLYAQNEHEPRLIASITKLMTALVAVECSPDLSQMVTVDPQAAGTEGSSIYLAAGEELTLETLVYGLLLQSGNDAAVAIAIYCGGDVETFVEWMNQRAESLGMTNSHFANPNGLNDETHYSTAYDMALLARACMDNPTIAAIVGTKSITLGTRSFQNHNKLLWRYEGCVGMKTGYTEQAGRTLVSAATRDGETLLAVTLADPNDWADHAALFDYGFATYRRQLLAHSGKVVTRLTVSGSLLPWVTVVTEGDLSWPLTADERVTAKISLPPQLTAPVVAGSVVGNITFYLAGRELGRTYLVAQGGAPVNLPHRKALFTWITPLMETAEVSLWRAAFCQTMIL